MRKTRFLAIILIVSVILMGAGYAYWTQELTITNTIRTGKFDVVFDAASITPDQPKYMQATSEIVGDKKHKLKFEINNAYPGARCDIEFNLKNIGSIGAILDELTIQHNLNDYKENFLFGDINVGGKGYPHQENNNLDVNQFMAFFNNYIVNKEHNGTLEKDSNKIVKFSLSIKDDIEEKLPQNTKFKFTVTATFKQHILAD